MISRIGPIQESSEWLELLDAALPEIRTANFALQINKLLSKAQHLLEDEPENPEQATEQAESLSEMSVEMEDIDIKIQSGFDDIPRAWKVKWIDTMPLVEGILSLVTTNRLQVFHDVKVAEMWNYLSVCRLILHETRIQCLMCIQERQELSTIFLDEDLNQILKTSQETVYAIADEVLSRSPFLLGLIDQDGNAAHATGVNKNLGAYFLRISLCILLRAKSITENQREKTTAVLQRVDQQLKRAGV
jgi:hypothetical protein